MDNHLENEINKIKAQRILDLEMPAKEFWFVDSEDDCNKDELQFVLNNLFQDCDNCYEAVVSHHQNTSRLIIRCNICNTSLTSYDPFLSHHKGKSHKKAIQVFKMADNSSLKNAIGSIVFKTLDEMENNFEPGTLEDQLFKTTHVVLGWQFVYSEYIEGESSYTCHLCSKYRMSQRRTFNHLISDNHILTYIDLKFRKRGKFEHLIDFINEVQRREGKITCKITTLGTHGKSHSSRNHKEEMTESHASTSWLRSPKFSEHVQTLPVRPPTPPSPVKRDRATQVDISEQTFNDFMREIQGHFDNIKDGSDDLSEELRSKNHVDVQDLLIQVVKCMAQKMYIYSLENEIFAKNECLKLMNYTDKIKISQNP